MRLVLFTISLLIVLSVVCQAQSVTWNVISSPISDPLDSINHIGTDGTYLYVVFTNTYGLQGGGQQFWRYKFNVSSPLSGSWIKLATPPRTICSVNGSVSDLAYQNGYFYMSALANNGGRTIVRYKVSSDTWEVWQNGGVDINICATTGNAIFMDPTQDGVGYSASHGGNWVKFNWNAKTCDNNWMSTSGLGVPDAGWVSRNEDVAIGSNGTYYATKNDTIAGLSDGDVIYKWTDLSSPNPSVVIKKPWQCGFGQSIEFVPSTISPSGHDELWLLRGADGSTNPADGSGSWTYDLARLDLTNVAGGWITSTLPGQVGYTGEIVRVGRNIFVRSKYSSWYVATLYHPISVGQLKTYGDGTEADVNGVVSAVFPSEKVFYIQSADRSSGVRVSYPGTNLPSVGQSLVVNGTIQTDTTTRERYISCSGWWQSGSSQTVKPIGVTTKTLGGGQMGYQAGVEGGVGLSNVGLLVKISGKVTGKQGIDDCWYISDGLRKNDGGSIDGIKVDLTALSVPDRPSPDIGNFVVVTGVCGTYVGTDGEVHPVVRVRNSSDLQNLSVKKYKVIVVNADPHCPSYGNLRTHEVFGWGDPHVLCQTYIDDLKWASAGYANYEVVDWIDCEYHMIDTKGFQFTPDGYVAAWQNGTACSQYSGMNYPKFLTDKSYPHNNPKSLAERVAAGECDEIFLFGAPCGDGQWEAAMAGPSPFFVNGGTYYLPQTGKNVIIMGFNYERGVDCMLEDFCHRSECIMSRVYHPASWWFPTWPITNNWDRFRMIDKVAPGEAACGFCHYAPNSQSDYDWGNTTYVWSMCDDWLYNWPNLLGAVTKRWVNCSEWGNGDMRLHHKWWLNHIPKRSGVNPDGKQNNWWKYLCDYWSYPESR